jgi:hypothetical protein
MEQKRKQNKNCRAGSMAQVVEHLTCKGKALSSDPSTGREGGREGERKRKGRKRNFRQNQLRDSL